MSLIDESISFIEWTESALPPEQAAALEDLRVELEKWRREWPGEAMPQAPVGALANMASVWSDKILEMSGLTNEREGRGWF